MKATQLVDLICPNHSRTSCSDSRPINGFFTNGNVLDLNYDYGCPRCAMLDVIRGESFFGLEIKENVAKTFFE